MDRLDYTIIDLLEATARNIKAQPVNLGGVSGPGGGAGGPPGGFIGWLPQTRVAYDEDELASSGIAGSGTLVDNLNHIRYRLNILESGGSIVVYDDNSILEYPDTTGIHFSGGGITVMDLGGGEVQIVVTASGGGGAALTVEQIGGTPSVNNVDKIVISGGTVVDLGGGDVLISVSGGGNNTFIVHEDFSPTTSGTTHYNTYHVMLSGSLELYYNGIRQEPIQHYLEDSDGGGFTTLFIPESNDAILADYLTVTSGYPSPTAGTTIIYSGSSSFTPVGARVSRSTNQTIGNNSFTSVAFNTEVYDDDTMWAAGDPSVITCRTAGRYIITGYAGFSTSSTGARHFGITVNNVYVARACVPGISNLLDANGVTVTALVQLEVDDFIELVVAQNSGGNLDILGGYIAMAIQRVG